MLLLILIRPTPANFVRVPGLEDFNEKRSGVLGERSVLTRSSPAGGNFVESSITHAHENVSIFVKKIHGQLRTKDLNACLWDFEVLMG